MTESRIEGWVAASKDGKEIAEATFGTDFATVKVELTELKKQGYYQGRWRVVKACMTIATTGSGDAVTDNG